MGKVKRFCSLTIIFMVVSLLIAPYGYTFSKAVQQYDAAHNLKKYGVQINEVGDTVSIIIPSSILFPENAARLIPSAELVLNSIITYLGSFKKDLVYVDGFTDNVGSRERNIALSKQQALNVADYLWRTGIDARVQSAVGFGPDQPVATNETEEGRWQNRRIEINTRKIKD